MPFLVFVFPSERVSFLGCGPIFICFIVKQVQGLRPFAAHIYSKFTEVSPLSLGSGISKHTVYCMFLALEIYLHSVKTSRIVNTFFREN